MTADHALTRLADDEGYTAPEPVEGRPGEDHPMRTVTREVAFDRGWSTGRAAEVAELFDGLAPEWNTTRLTPERASPVADALRRGRALTDDPDGWWLELGSGTGVGTRVLAPLVERTAVVDLSAVMLANAPAELAPRIRADGARLPFPGHRFAGILLVNMLLFPDEIDRVLEPAGHLIWVNTAGDRTPIHLSAEELLDALPGRWTGTTARSGNGFWVCLRRADS